MRNHREKLFLLLLITAMFSQVSGQEYAFMYIANGSTASASLSNTAWHVVGSSTDADFVEDTTSTNWSYGSNRLKASTSLPEAVYLVKFSLSFGADLATWQIGISKNGATPSNIYQRRISNQNKDAGVVYGVEYLTLTANDSIELCVKPETTDKTFDPYHAQVVLVEMTDNSPNYYGGMKIENNTTTQTGIGKSFTPVTGFALNSQNNDWSVSNNELIAGNNSAGTYLVSFSASYSGQGGENNPETFDIGIALGSGTDPTTIITRRITSSSDVGNICGVGLLIISATNPLRLEIYADDASNNSEFTPYYSSISLYKLSGSSTAPRGHMKITSATSQTINDNNFTTVSGFSGGSSLHNWIYLSNALNAKSGTPSAGTYLVDYAVSLQKASGTGTDPVIAAFSIFLDATEQSELTIKRKLSDNIDVGAAGGTGLINIASASTKLYLKIKNETNLDDITINSCTVNLHRFVEGEHDGSLPVELVFFDGNSENNSVILNWETASEVENLGFIVERRQHSDAWREIANYKTHARLRGQGSVSHHTSYTFTDDLVIPGQVYNYRLADVDYKGVISYHSEISVLVKTSEPDLGLQSFILKPAFPNPFNPVTTIRYDLPQQLDVKVTIYNILGEPIITLVDQTQNPGPHQVNWYTRDEYGNQVATGLYLYRIDAGKRSQYGKLLLIR